jgi:hypothetical protein
MTIIKQINSGYLMELADRIYYSTNALIGHEKDFSFPSQLIRLE